MSPTLDLAPEATAGGLALKNRRSGGVSGGEWRGGAGGTAALEELSPKAPDQSRGFPPQDTHTHSEGNSTEEKQTFLSEVDGPSSSTS